MLAAHAVENAKLMLASDLTGHADNVGSTLMDHPTLYVWGLAPKPIGAYRGRNPLLGLKICAGAGSAPHMLLSGSMSAMMDGARHGCP